MRPEVGLVGRAREFARISEALDAAGGALLVSGEAGIGKSRLVREATRRAEDGGRLVLWGRPEQVARPGPYALLLDLLEDLVERAPGRGTRALRDRVGSIAGELPTRRVAAELRGLVAGAGSRPVVVLEDLHSADAASLATLAHLARSAADDGHWLLATYRLEEALLTEGPARFLDLTARERLATEVELGPLAAPEALELARSVVGRDLTGEERARVLDLGEGVPFFIETLAEAIAWGDGSDVPDSVARAVLARASYLPREARVVLAAAALAPGEVDARVIARAGELGPDEVAGALALASRAGLLIDRDGRLSFRHALVREALVAQTVSAERERMHVRLAEATEQIYGEHLAPHAHVLAHHFYAGREREKARRYALTAGERALSMAAAADARAAFELALACSPAERPPAEALRGIGESHLREGEGTRAEELYRRAAERFAGEGRPGEAALALARAAWLRRVSMGEPTEAERMLDEALVKLPQNAFRAERGRVLVEKGRLLHASRRAPEGEEALREAERTGRTLGDHELVALALEALATQADIECRQKEAAQWGLEACREGLVSGVAETIGRTHVNCAIVLGAHGEFEEALRLTAVARRELAKGFGAAGLERVLAVERMIWIQRGEPERARQAMTAGGGLWRETGAFTRDRVWVAVQQADWERAAAIVAEGWRAAEEDGGRATLERPDVSDRVFSAGLAELELAIERGDGTAAPLGAALLEAVSPVVRDRMLDTERCARALAVGANAGAAAAALARAEEDLARYPNRCVEGLLLEIGGILAMPRDPGGALSLYRTSEKSLRETGNAADRARLLRRIAGLVAEEDRRQAVDCLRQALALAAEAGSALEAGRAEAALRTLGVRPRSGRPRKGVRAEGGLSQREQEITALVAAGATNREIAQRLFLSLRTVEDHIGNAMRRLGLGGRAGLAAWAAKHGLV